LHGLSVAVRDSDEHKGTCGVYRKRDENLVLEKLPHAATDVVVGDDLSSRSTPDEPVGVAERRSFVDTQGAIVLFLDPDIHTVRPTVIRGFGCVHKTMRAQHLHGRKRKNTPHSGLGRCGVWVTPANSWKNKVAKTVPGTLGSYGTKATSKGLLEESRVSKTKVFRTIETPRREILTLLLFSLWR
jgi:hypothetical protein